MELGNALPTAQIFAAGLNGQRAVRKDRQKTPTLEAGSDDGKDLKFHFVHLTLYPRLHLPKLTPKTISDVRDPTSTLHY